MNCTSCNLKNCRDLSECKVFKGDNMEISKYYHMTKNQEIIQAAAKLVDNGRAGTLSRLDEIIEFIKLMDYKTVGLAYCYGMEIQAAIIVDILRKAVPSRLVSVSCTTGSMSQSEVNDTSCIHKVSCNPISQASQINRDGADFVITMGLCMGHDILFNKYIEADTTTFIAKDRVNNHNPIKELENKQKDR
jgi:uncharacterized metal-binding protein